MKDDMFSMLYKRNPILYFLIGIVLLGGCYNGMGMVPLVPKFTFVAMWIASGSFLITNFRLIDIFAPRKWMVNYGWAASFFITLFASKIVGLPIVMPYFGLAMFMALTGIVVAVDEAFSDRVYPPKEPVPPGMRVALDGKIMAGVVLKIKHCDGINPMFWYIGKDGIVTKVSNGGLLVPFNNGESAIIPFYTSGRRKNVDYAEEVVAATENVDFQVTP